MDDSTNGTLRVSRRSLLKGLGIGVTTATAASTRAAAPTSGDKPVRLARGRVPVTLRVNGAPQKVMVEPRQTLLEILRNTLDLTGAKPVCNHGSCGACTVLLDGKPRYSCMTFALDAEGHEITTVEGLTPAGGLSPVQQAFVEKDALMCGFCTPGFVVSATALLRDNPNPSGDEIRRGCAGNTCRCGTYPRIFEAVAAAARARKEG